MTTTLSEPGITTEAQPFQWNFVGDRPVEVELPGARPADDHRDREHHRAREGIPLQLVPDRQGAVRDW